MAHHPTFFLILALFLSACVNSHGINPQISLLDANKLDAGTIITASGHSEWPTAAWWHAYGDAQLNTLVDQAVAGNPGIQTAQARLRQAEAAAQVAGAALEPRVDANLSLNRTHWSDAHYYPPGYSGLTDWNNQAALGLSFDLDLWGKYRSELEGAVDAIRVADAEAQVVKLSLEAAVVHAYVQLSLSYALQDILANQLKREEEVYDITRKRMKAGLSTGLETSQAEAPLPALRGQVEKLSAQIAVLRNQLAALSGQGPGAGEHIARPALSLASGIALPTAIPAELIGHRPDIAARRWQVEAAGKNIEVAKTQFYPNINLAATLGTAALTPGLFNFAQGNALTYGVGPALSLPIFDAGRLRGNLGAATAGYDIAVSAYNDAVIQAVQEVASQLVMLTSLEKQRQQAQAAVDVAKKSEDITRRGYVGGLTEYLNVLNAENRLFDAQRQAAQVKADQLQAHALLMQALGGGVAP